MTALVVAGAIMASLGLLLSSMLAMANKKLYVADDPRIEAAENLLPHANCGACGFPGCRAFAEVLATGETTPGRCSASPVETVKSLAALLGVEADLRTKRVARLACAGARHVARRGALYRGLQSCRAASLAGGGGKGCAWGCLSLGDCAGSCPFGAITLNEHHLPVVDEEKCTACGECVIACPKKLFSLHDAEHRLWVACRNQQMGKAAEAECEVACTGCGRCVRDAAEGLISIMDNLATIDYGKIELASLDAIQRCPTGAIVWIDPENGPIEGQKAKQAALARQAVRLELEGAVRS